MKKQKDVKKKIVISSKSFNEDYEILKEKGYEIDMNYGTSYDEEKMIKIMDPDVVGIIAGTEPITMNVMECAPNLKVISRYGIGTDNIDLKYAKERGIKIFTTDAHVNAVAEHTLMFMLAHLKNIVDINKTKNNMLEGKIVGIIGYGKVGQRVHKLVSAFGAKVATYDVFIAEYNHSVSLEKLLKNSDIITLHLPHTPETTNMIDYEQFDLIKEGTIFINTSRARIVNESALLDFVKNPYNKAGLDVCLHPELFEDKRNVLITYHEASYTHETRKQMAEDAINNLLEGLK